MDTSWQESIVCEGWLTKSPPEKRLWKSKWRERYFVLKQTGHIPCQYLLEYYSDSGCKKIKGSIDLDECQQIDAGLSLKFESGAKSNKHVFDIKTGRRTYYLAAKTEEDMNRWVQSICSVCGLNRKNEDVEDENSDQSDNHVQITFGQQPLFGATTTTNIMPDIIDSAPSSLPRFMSSNHTQVTSGEKERLLVVVPPESSSSLGNNQSNHHDSNTSRNNQDAITSNLNCRGDKSSSDLTGPYIPISECHSGKSGITQQESKGSNVTHNNNNNNNKQYRKNTPGGRSASSSSILSSQQRSPAVSIPRQPASSSKVQGNLPVTQQPKSSKASNVIRADEFYDIPRSSGSKGKADESAPLVNWGTFPGKDDANRASTRSFSGSNFISGPAGNTLRSSAGAVEGVSSSSTLGRSRCDSGGKLLNPGPTASLRRSVTPTGNEYMNTKEQSLTGDSAASAPPRPPKPETLRRSKSKSESSSSLPENNSEDFVGRVVPAPTLPVIPAGAADAYDIPRTREELKESTGKTGNHRLPDVIQKGKSMDFMYDFPKSSNASNISIIHTRSASDSRRRKPSDSDDDENLDLSATVPVPQFAALGIDANASSSGDGSSRHNYTNSAPGFFGNKESVFIYDHKPSLPVMSDDAITQLDFLKENPVPSSVSLQTTSSGIDSSLDSVVTGTAIQNQQQHEMQPDLPERSPRTPGGGTHFFANNIIGNTSEGVTPPAVDRNLKPRKSTRGSESDAASSPSTPKQFQLSPPPAVVKRTHNGHQGSSINLNNKFNHRTVGKDSNCLGQPVYDAVPRVPSSRPLSSTVHSREASGSEDDAQSNLKSRIDDKTRGIRKNPRQIPEGTEELNYLDLDLVDSDNSSPRTPNMDTVAPKTSSSPRKEVVHHNLGNNGQPVPSSSSLNSSLNHPVPQPSHSIPRSTVYKTVDFIKTDALNKLRHNIQEGHRT